MTYLAHSFLNFLIISHHTKKKDTIQDRPSIDEEEKMKTTVNTSSAYHTVVYH